MTQILDALPTQLPNRILCRYAQSPSLQVVRIANIPHWYFERVVFPMTAFSLPLSLRRLSKSMAVTA